MGSTIAQAISNLHEWLQTMRQPGGYGGPVAHWWQSRYQYTGPGLDWRYEGILIGYVTLIKQTGDPRWRSVLQTAARDLMAGQRLEGTYTASQFELNPGVLGTPHEAAASYGLLHALPYVNDKNRGLGVARKNLENLVAQLWDPETGGFNDRPGVKGRVPNKLATLALALLQYAKVSGDTRYHGHARSALEDILRYQVHQGEAQGAVHQYVPSGEIGDGRFFPFYNARCVPALLQGGDVLEESRYVTAARAILDFLRRTMHEDGTWPQIVYQTGKRAEWPRWIAGSADTLLAFVAAGQPVPIQSLETMLMGQLPSGGFRTARGFASQILQRAPGPVPDIRDVTAVVGWNDKALRLLASLLPVGVTIPPPDVDAFAMPVHVRGILATYREDGNHIQVVDKNSQRLYHWNKSEPWANASNAVYAR